MSLNLKRYIEDYEEFHFYLRNKSLKDLYDKDVIYTYLHNEVFKRDDFINNIQEVADAEEKHYDVIYTVITLYFVDIFYDIIMNIQKRRMVKINIYGYLFLIIDFDYNLSDKHRKILDKELRDLGKII